MAENDGQLKEEIRELKVCNKQMEVTEIYCKIKVMSQGVMVVPC